MSLAKKRQNSTQNDKKKTKYQQLDDQQLSSLQTCSTCTRRFTENRLIEHERTCQKSQIISSHRYHYNTQLHRWKNLNYHINTNTKHSPKITHWKEKHQQFQSIVKGEMNDMIQSSNDRPYQCSQCQRKFATEIAITKHQKGCKGKRYKK